MNQRHSISIAMLLALTLGVARAQDNPPAQAPDSGQPSAQEPVPAFGQENPPQPVSENPPISGLDLPALGPHAAPLSYLQPGLHLTQSVDSNVADTVGGSNTRSITRALGSLDLQRLWSRYKLALDYAGGAGYYNAPHIGLKQVQQLELDQRISWKRGQLGLRDSFSYLPEGNFGGAYGSLNSEEQILAGGGIGGQGGFPGGAQFGALGQTPRIVNLALVDLTENLTPKSSLTANGGYAIEHFTHRISTTAGLPFNSFLGSSEISAQAGYDRNLGPHDQAALVYGYQGFDFSFSGLAFHSHVIQAMWGHRLSGRMDFVVGAGPQFTMLATSGSPSNLRITTAGRASLRYKFPDKMLLNLSFFRYNTSGSGIFAGAVSNVARLSVHRPITRVWSAFVDAGYAHNTRLQVLPTIPGSTFSLAKTYDYGFAGLGAERRIGRSFRFFASYQFNDLAFDSSFCTPQTVCSRISQRHVGSLGLDWTPRPIRID